MEIYRDFQEFFKSLNNLGVEYVIVGGYAMAFHGVPRATQDMDILLHAEKDNARRIVAALYDFGFGELGFKQEDFQQERLFVAWGDRLSRLTF